MKISLKDTHDLVITHPATGEDLVNDKKETVTVTIFGSQSTEYKKAKNRALNKRMGKIGKKPTAEQLEVDGLELLVDCTKSFNNFEKMDFGSGVIDPKNIKQAYVDTPWFKDQVDAAITDNSLFI